MYFRKTLFTLFENYVKVYIYPDLVYREGNYEQNNTKSS